MPGVKVPVMAVGVAVEIFQGNWKFSSGGSDGCSCLSLLFIVCL